MASDIAIPVPDDDPKRKKILKKESHTHFALAKPIAQAKPEWRYQLLLCLLVLVETVSLRLGQIASIWATTILLGGFITTLDSFDFWLISALTLASSLRIFGLSHEQRINSRIQTRRRVLLKWLLSSFRRSVSGSPLIFHISKASLVAGAVDLTMFLLQLLSSVVSLVFSLLRLAMHRKLFTSDEKNQTQAILLYYSLVVAENVLFIPGKIGWEVPPPFDNTFVFWMTHDKEKMGTIFDILDGYFVQVLSVARQNLAQGLCLSLRQYVSDMLAEDRVDRVAGIHVLEVLYQQEEDIKRKSDADKRALLVPFVLDHIRDTSDVQSRSAAYSLLANLLVHKTGIKFGPLVLLKALERPETVELLVSVTSLVEPVSKYVENCLESESKDEVVLAVRVVRKLPLSFIQRTRIPELMLKLVSTDEESGSVRHEVDIPALVLVVLTELGLELPAESVVRRVVERFIRRSLKTRELEVLLALNRCGMLSSADRRRVNLSNFFSGINFVRCLDELVEWLASLENESLCMQLGKLRENTRAWLTDYLETSRGRHRPNITRLCGFLVKDSYFFEKRHT